MLLAWQVIIRTSVACRPHASRFLVTGARARFYPTATYGIQYTSRATVLHAVLWLLERGFGLLLGSGRQSSVGALMAPAMYLKRKLSCIRRFSPTRQRPLLPLSCLEGDDTRAQWNLPWRRANAATHKADLRIPQLAVVVEPMLRHGCSSATGPMVQSIPSGSQPPRPTSRGIGLRTSLGDTVR